MEAAGNTSNISVDPLQSVPAGGRVESAVFSEGNQRSMVRGDELVITERFLDEIAEQINKVQGKSDRENLLHNLLGVLICSTTGLFGVAGVFIPIISTVKALSFDGVKFDGVKVVFGLKSSVFMFAAGVWVILMTMDLFNQKVLRQTQAFLDFRNKIKNMQDGPEKEACFQKLQMIGQLYISTKGKINKNLGVIVREIIDSEIINPPEATAV